MMRLGIDIGGTKTAIGLFSGSGKPIRSTKIPSEGFSLIRLESAIESLLQNERIASCGVGIPGTVSPDGRHILKAPNLDILPGLCDQLESKLGVPCKLVQDSRAAAWGEYTLGAGRGSKCLICVTLGTGIGTGLVIDGKLFNGALGTAGELGHIPSGKAEGRVCGCGKLDCTEKYAAGGGLDLTARKLLGDGKSSHDLFEAAELGCREAAQVIDEAALMIGRIMVGAVNLLSPDCVLFSGGLSRRDRFLDAITDCIKTDCYSSGSLPHIGRAALGELAPLFGAAMLG